MRCLKCRYDGLEEGETTCLKCKTYLPPLMRDMLPSGTILGDGKYKLNYPLGRGGFGITYHAHHIGFNRPVAIKEFFPHRSVVRDGDSLLISIGMSQQDDYSKSMERFMREGQTLFDLVHPNVVRVHDLFQANNTAYIVMELIEGRTLREKLDFSENNRLAPKEVEEIIDQLVFALSEIHKRNLCHLDLSPDNVMMDESKNRAVLIDFGAAKQLFQEVYSTMAFKHQYTPYELLEIDGNFGPESDLFELSMMIHEMLTGKLPPPSWQRFSKAEPWVPSEVPSNWRGLLKSGLQLLRQDRPNDIRKWWLEYKKTRIVLGKRRPHKLVIGAGKKIGQ